MRGVLVMQIVSYPGAYQWETKKVESSVIILIYQTFHNLAFVKDWKLSKFYFGRGDITLWTLNLGRNSSLLCIPVEARRAEALP